jgi:tetratricopeptide (TPR) repeat protein
VYQRVLEILPGDLRAEAALETFGAAAVPVAPAPRATTKAKRYTGSVESVPVPAAEAPKTDDGDFVSLGDWLRADEGPKSTRMVVAEEEPTGDEQADFADMLKKFKQGVADNVEEEDHESHYDLGVAFKEMGLLDEAIAEFQKALRGTAKRVRTYEALGQCFLEKKQLPVATTILQRALNEPGIGDEQLVGVLYLLGYINESMGKLAEAKPFYERVFGVDIQFRDVGDRLNAVDKAAK